MERRYTYSRNRLTLAGYMVHNSEGYVEYTYHRSAGTAEMVSTEQIPPRPSVVVQQTQYYYHRNHLGNNCVVWDATNNRIVQRTWYYAGGTPMSNSIAQGLQPYKYNGKEYVEAHGYDVYDYGFRGYYATIGRFTSIDPLCEYTPWQSPYAYANNNWINQIDILGLAGSDAFTTQDPTKISKLLAFLDHGGSLDSYDFDKEGWEEAYVERWWIENENLYYMLVSMTGDITYKDGAGQLPEVSATLMHTRLTSSHATTILEDIRDEYSGIGWINTAGDIAGWGSAIAGVVGNATCNELYWFGKNGKVYTVNQRLKGAKGSYTRWRN